MLSNENKVVGKPCPTGYTLISVTKGASIESYVKSFVGCRLRYTHGGHAAWATGDQCAVLARHTERSLWLRQRPRHHFVEPHDGPPSGSTIVLGGKDNNRRPGSPGETRGGQ